MIINFKSYEIFLTYYEICSDFYVSLHRKYNKKHKYDSKNGCKDQD